MGFLTGRPAQSSGKSVANSQQTSSSSGRSFNNYYPQAQQDFGSTAASTGDANNAMRALLGIGGDPTAQNKAFDNYKNSTGYNFQMQQGQDAITGSAAAKGLLNSGSTAKGLQNFGQNLASTKFNDYLSQIMGVGNQGLQAGGLLANAGQENVSQSQSQGTSSSTSTEQKKDGKEGLFDIVGGAIPGLAFSDPRLKKNVVKIGKMENGLNVYTFDYINGDGPHTGVMADEVAALVPEALGPVIGGYMTVDYNLIGE